jgi:hypothetical protein
MWTRQRIFVAAIAVLAVLALGGGAFLGARSHRGSGHASAAYNTETSASDDKQVAAAAASDSVSADPTVWQYAGEFLCGAIPPSPGPPSTPFYLGPGLYNTEISVHNANTDPATFIQKKVVPLPQPEQEGIPTARKRLALHPDGAFQIDCADITTFFPLGTTCASAALLPNFCKGYVVVEGGKCTTGLVCNIIPAPLDVTVTVTVANTSGTTVSSIDFELLPGKLVDYACWSNGLPGPPTPCP